MTIGQKIALLRTSLNLSQEQLAEKLENDFSVVFSAPEITRVPGQTRVHFCQAAPMSLSVAVRQTSRDTVSGDRFSHFCGADGCTYLLLCDGA